MFLVVQFPDVASGPAPTLVREDMERTKWVWLCLWMGLLLCSVPTVAEAKNDYGKWVLVKKTKTVKIYQMRMKKSAILAMRGDAILNAPLSKVVYLLEDIAHRKQWIDRLKNVKILQDTPPYKRVMYSHFTLPWPMAHRDFVYDTVLKLDEKNKRVLYFSKSIKHPKAPKTPGVRAVLAHNVYILEPYDKGRKTKARIEIHGDPKGWLPAWIVNIVQKSWPIKTMDGMQKELKKGWIKHHPLIKKAMIRWGTFPSSRPQNTAKPPAKSRKKTN